ncbi:hypothetical protein COJ15_36465 [Bacillus thuringiensis]|uniref:Uncharacterized protein n=1 Tax=Bacillus thuringiensis TaxID=1428 RepID=A0A9X6WGS2_BACTU|nr:hypothetical protein COJ15_36465 [Bacillus thuringiensis]
MGDRAITGQNKRFLKVLYFRIHVLCFMGTLGSGGYFWAKQMGIVDVECVILITLLTAIPAVSTLLPFLRKEHILFL